MRTAKTLIRLGGCPGWSESSLGAQSLCWFCHVAAHVNSRSWLGNNPVWDYTVCPGLSVHKLRIITVIVCKAAVTYCLPPGIQFLAALVALTDIQMSQSTKQPTKWPVRPAKTQISLGIHPVWSVIPVHMKKPWGLGYPLSAYRRLWSDWADAQPDLSLC